MSGNGLSGTRGLTTPEVTVAASDRALVAAGERRIVLADYTKIGKDTMWQTMSAAEIDILVTDDKAPPSELEALRREGVEVIIVKVAAPAGGR